MENKELKERFVDEKTGIEYTLVGDYYLKATNQMEWVQSMNSIKNRAEEMAYNEIIYK